MTISDAEIAEAERLHAAATKGEWERIHPMRDDAGRWFASIDVKGKICLVARGYGHGDARGTGDVEALANAACIVALRNSFPGLLARLRAAEAELDALREVRDAAEAWNVAYVEFGRLDQTPEERLPALATLAEKYEAMIGALARARERRTG